MRLILGAFCISSLLASLCAAQPYIELDTVRKDSSFCYEQYQLPADLRMILAATDVAHYQSFELNETDDNQLIKQRSNLEALIADCPVPLGSLYVARKFAPATYDVVMQMCHRLGIPVPLLFIALRGPDAHKMQMVSLGGGYHAVVIGAAFLRRRNIQECQAVMAYQLAQISKKVTARSQVARKVWKIVAGVGGGVYLLYLLDQSRKEERGKRWRPFANALFSWGGWVALLAASWGVSEVVYTYLKKRYRDQAHKAALTVFNGGENQYYDCLRRAYKDVHIHALQEYESYRLYYNYVSSRIDELADHGVPPLIIHFFRQLVQKRQEKHLETPLSQNDELPI